MIDLVIKIKQLAADDTVTKWDVLDAWAESIGMDWDGRDKNCKHTNKEVIAKTMFGHGDSQTFIWAKCKKCGAVGDTIQQMGFPATYENMRKAHSEL